MSWVTDRSNAEKRPALEKGFVFDDESLEAILYGAPSPGPSSANLFLRAQPNLERIDAAIEQDAVSMALQRIRLLLESQDKVVSQPRLLLFVQYVSRFVPATYPCPLVEDHGVPYGAILTPCYERGIQYRNADLIEQAGWVLYRWHESRADYRAAMGVIEQLLDHGKNGKTRGDRLTEARLINNFGYEYFLAEQWEAAISYFNKAIVLFERLAEEPEVANARANLLLC